MLKLLKIEWMKLKHYRTFWVLSLLYVVSIFGINYIVLYIQHRIYEAKQAKGMAEMILGSPPYSFPYTWQATSYVSSFLLLIPGLLMIISMTNEYSYKTHRQNIIDGWSRRQFISVKIMMALLMALASTILVFLTAIIFGLIDGSSSFTFDHVHYVWYYFLQAFSYICVGLLIAVLVKRGGLSIGIFFLYTLIIEEMLVKVLNRYANYAGRYLPLETTDLLVPFPNIERMSRQITGTPNYTALFILALVYLSAYLLIISRKFETSDL